jgi:hypothetical protein
MRPQRALKRALKHALNASQTRPQRVLKRALKHVPNASQTRPQRVLKRAPNAPSNTPSSTPQTCPKRVPNASSNAPLTRPQTRPQARPKRVPNASSNAPSNAPSRTPQTPPKRVPNTSSNALPTHPHKIQDKFSVFSVSFMSKLNCLGPLHVVLGRDSTHPLAPPICCAAESCVIIARPPSCRGIVACTHSHRGVIAPPAPRPRLCRCTRPPCVSLHAPRPRVVARAPCASLHAPPLHASCMCRRTARSRLGRGQGDVHSSTRRTARCYTGIRARQFEFISTFCSYYRST